MAAEESTDVVLARIDGRLSTVEEGVKELRTEMRGGFERQEHLRNDVYAANRATDKDYAAETRKIAEHARTVAHATAVLLVTGLGLVLALIKAVAG